MHHVTLTGKKGLFLLHNWEISWGFSTDVVTALIIDFMLCTCLDTSINIPQTPIMPFLDPSLTVESLSTFTLEKWNLSPTATSMVCTAIWVELCWTVSSFKLFMLLSYQMSATSEKEVDSCYWLTATLNWLTASHDQDFHWAMSIVTYTT